MTTTIFTFIWTYNDFFSQLLYLNTENNYTVSLGLRQFLDASGQSSWGPMFAMTTLSLVPVFFIFLFFQRLLIEVLAVIARAVDHAAVAVAGDLIQKMQANEVHAVSRKCRGEERRIFL